MPQIRGDGVSVDVTTQFYDAILKICAPYAKNHYWLNDAANTKKLRLSVRTSPC
jgi:hypothetical protein